MALEERFINQAKEFIIAVLRARNPRLNTSSNSAIYDAFIAPGSLIQAAIQQEIEHLRQANSLSSHQTLSEEDMDQLAENFLTSGRSGGSEAVGTVQAYYSTSKERIIGSGAVCRTRDGKAYETQEDLTFLVEDHLSRDGSFFINVPFTAKTSGEAGETGSHTITSGTGLGDDLLKVDNDNAFVGGSSKETNAEFFQKLQKEVSSRNIATSDGMISVLRDFQGTLIESTSIGYGDSAMLRDEMYEAPAPTGFNLTRTGTATGIHVGGRVDQYSWFRRLSFVQKVIDKSDDYALLGDHAPGVFTVEVSSVSSTVGTALSATGRLVLDFGKTDQEVVSYAGFTSFGVGNVRFSIPRTLVRAHSSGGPVRVASNSTITINPVGGDIDVVPVLFIQKVETLDPITLEPFGDPLPETDTGIRSATGWRLANIDPYNFLGAREVKTLVLDEKDVIHNQPLTFLGAFLVPGNTLVVPALPGNPTPMTNRQGQTFTYTMEGSGLVNTRTVLRVEADGRTILYSGAELPGGIATTTFPSLVGQYSEFPIQVSYFTNLEHTSIQELFDSPGKRALGEDYQARNFLPVFLDFTVRYRGSVSAADMRKAVIDVLQPPNILFNPTIGTSVDVSDIVVALGTAGADFIELPFEIRSEEVAVDGVKTIRYVFPSQATRAVLSVHNTAVVVGDRNVIARVEGTEYTPPSSGTLRFERVEVAESRAYSAALLLGTFEDDQFFNFILDQAITFAHPITEAVLITKTDFIPALEITTGTIVGDSIHRPYLRNVVFENLDE